MEDKKKEVRNRKYGLYLALVLWSSCIGSIYNLYLNCFYVSGDDMLYLLLQKYGSIGVTLFGCVVLIVMILGAVLFYRYILSLKAQKDDHWSGRIPVEVLVFCSVLFLGMMNRYIEKNNFWNIDDAEIFQFFAHQIEEEYYAEPVVDPDFSEYYPEEVKDNSYSEAKYGIARVINYSMHLLLYSILFLETFTILVCQLKVHNISKYSISVKIYQNIHTIKKQMPILKHLYYKKIIFVVFEIVFTSYEVLWVAGIIQREEKILLAIIIPSIIQVIMLCMLLGNSNIEYQMVTLLKQIEQITFGAKDVENKLPRTSAFYDAAENLRDIELTLHVNIEKAIKNEKMKVDLITNISHDLKTPLTSMIGYIDLLEKEHLSDEGKHEVQVLKKKAEGLRQMIQELFELAKVTSGNVELEWSELNLNKLILQTMGDMEEYIQNSSVVLKQELSKEELLFLGDGSKLYYVCQNLIENALKYAMPGTRIYLRTYCRESRVWFSIQNTAAYEMNFSGEEITGRFVRGDKERTGKGNGLGLAIAKNYTEVCGGSFEVIVDGDLFKVIISFENIV